MSLPSASSLLLFSLLFSEGCVRAGFAGFGDGAVEDQGAAGEQQPGDMMLAGDALPHFGMGHWTFGLVTIVPKDLRSDFQFSGDGQLIYHNAYRGPGDCDLFELDVPSSFDVPLGAARVLEGLITSAGEWSLSTSGDGLSAVLVAVWPGGTGFADIWLGRRASARDAWRDTDFTRSLALSGPQNDWDATLSTDGLRVYFAPQVAQMQQIMVAERLDTQSDFAAPRALLSKATVWNGDPTLTGDGRVLIYIAPGASGEGDVDLWYAIADGSGEFGEARPLPAPINTTDDELEPAISPDGRQLLFIRREAALLVRVEIVEGP